MATSPLPFRVVRTDQWGAVKPSGAISRVGKPSRIIFHHTAGHVPSKAPGETYAEAVAYARAIQQQHMGQGWVDSGHNFLVTRGGYILEGRHGSLASITVGRMVTSAHCPGQNDQPGIEHEHNGNEKMTAIQRQASIWLHTYICKACGILPSNIEPHKKYFATACPGALAAGLPAFRKDVAASLAPVDDNEAWYDKYGPKNKPKWFFDALQEYHRRLNGSG